LSFPGPAECAKRLNKGDYWLSDVPGVCFTGCWTHRNVEMLQTWCFCYIILYCIMYEGAG
jgi:hypothetical protein